MEKNSKCLKKIESVGGEYYPREASQIATDAINQLIKRKPQLRIQTKKEGKTKQARKKYKVTAEGIKAVQKLLNTSE